METTMDVQNLKILADKQAAAAAGRVRVMIGLAHAQRSEELDKPTIEVIVAGVRIRKLIGKCTTEQIEAYAARCDFEAQRAREYLAKRKQRR
jgi:hypothetical protein